MKIDDEMLMAFADGELAGEEADAVAVAVDADPVLAARLERYRLTRSMIAEAAQQAPSPRPGLMEAARRRAEAAQMPRPAFWRSPAPMAIAAGAGGLVIGLGAMQLIAATPALDAEAGMTAGGVLADALSGVTSNVRYADGGQSVEVIYTVRAADDRPCRVFKAQFETAVEGAACLEDGVWRVIALAETDPVSEVYVPAASGASSLIESAVDGLSPGDPLTAEDEVALIREGWAGD
jgi:hypothetical protein